MIDKILQVPVSVSETGYILIVGDATSRTAKASPSVPASNRWDYLALVYDPISRTRYGQAFSVSKSELSEWTA